MNWHYVDQGQQAGPVTGEQLRQLFQSGTVTADTLVWREGMADWTPYSQVSLPPTPPVSDQPPLSNAQSQPGESEVVCAECGKMFPVSETVRFGKATVCAACKPVFLQKLSEGAPINTGGLILARIPARFAALFLDGLIVGAASFGIDLIIRALAGVTASRAAVNHLLLLEFQFILIAINVSIAAAYEGIMVGAYGQTLGKRACNIKVVTADGGKVGYGRAIGRYFAKQLNFFTCLIGYIIALFDDERRALHDHICGTRVVET